MSKRVLVLEDDPGFRTLVRVTLAERGFEVVEVTRAKRARPLVTEQHFDLLLVEALLPDGSGADFIIWARSQGYAGPILFLSQFWKDLATYRSLTEEWQVSRVLSKPITAAQLAVEVDSVFRPEGSREPARPVAEGATSPGCRDAFQGELVQLRRGYAERFAQSLGEARDTLARARENEDAAALADGFRRVHSLAGSSGSFGFEESGAMLRHIESEIEGLMEKPDDASDDAWRGILASLAAGPAAFGVEARALGLFITEADRIRGPAAAVRERHDTGPEVRSRVVLLVDDPALTETLGAAFHASGLDAEVATDPATLLDTLASHSPSLLLVRASMRRVSGFDVCRWLRGTSAWRDLPILLVTASEGHEIRRACFDAGANDFVSQPLDFEELNARTRALLAR